MAQSSASLTVIHRDRHGKPDFIYPCDGGVVTCVNASANICRGMLRNMKIRSAFLSFIREFNRSQPKWYHEASHGFESYEDVVDSFITTILAIFPVVYIDDSLDNPDRLGGHLRREWDVDFQPYDQSIDLNGSVSGRLGS